MYYALLLAHIRPVDTHLDHLYSQICRIVCLEIFLFAYCWHRYYFILEMIKAVPEGFKAIKEGISSILVPINNSVFYNPVQEFNRDLSVVVVRVFSEQLVHGEWANSRKKHLVDKKVNKDRFL